LQRLHNDAVVGYHVTGLEEAEDLALLHLTGLDSRSLTALKQTQNVPHKQPEMKPAINNTRAAMNIRMFEEYPASEISNYSKTIYSIHS